MLISPIQSKPILHQRQGAVIQARLRLPSSNPLEELRILSLIPHDIEELGPVIRSTRLLTKARQDDVFSRITQEPKVNERSLILTRRTGGCLPIKEYPLAFMSFIFSKFQKNGQKMLITNVFPFETASEHPRIPSERENSPSCRRLIKWLFSRYPKIDIAQLRLPDEETEKAYAAYLKKLQEQLGIRLYNNDSAFFPPSLNFPVNPEVDNRIWAPPPEPLTRNNTYLDFFSK